MLIGLGTALVYRKIKETVTAVKSPLRRWAELLALRLWLYTAIWITSWRLLTTIWITTWRSSQLCKGNWINLETGRKRSRRANWRLLPRPNNPNLICFRPPQPAGALAKAVAGTTTPLKIAAVRLSCIPFPLSTDTCGLLSLSRTFSRLSPWQRQSCELRICLIVA